ncbi:hypothetical protein ACR0ST_00980 [Aliidiomarina sp. Khilg15.8]
MLDADAGLARCGGKVALYHRLLESFFYQYQPWLNTPMDAASIAPAQAQQLAHNLKSTAPAIGATPLSELASELAPPAAEPTEQQSETLLLCLNQTLQAIQARFPTCTHNEQVKELLRRLEQHNIEALNLYENWVREQANHWPKTTLHAIKSALDSFNFEQARQLLQQGLTDFPLATGK